MNSIDWNNWMQQERASFLQSWEWGDFQERYGRQVHRLHSQREEGNASWAAQVLGHQLPAGRMYLFAPYGPVVNGEQTAQDSAIEILDALQAVAAKDKAIFLRYEGERAMLGGRRVTAVHPEYTRVITLSDPDTLLAGMKPKWRYNIRLAERKGVTVRVSTAVEDVDAVYTLLVATAKRQHIRIHPLSYYQLMVSHLAQFGMAQMYLAEYQGQLIAGNIMIGFGHTMTYVHGGSLAEQHAVMAPHLLQWRAMCGAYENGYAEYDLFGIAPPDQPNHPWSGISRFKAGFGGTVRRVGGTYEIPFQPVWYNAYRMIKRVWI